MKMASYWGRGAKLHAGCRVQKAAVPRRGDEV